MVQSAIARWVLNQHLIHLGITSAEESGMHDDLDIAFNVLWADNGDAISREYAGTSALKGDFTRTGKRDWRGAMNEYVYRATVALDHPRELMLSWATCARSSCPARATRSPASCSRP